MTEPVCDICGDAATVKAWYGPVKEFASTWGTDRPFEENHVFRCGRHKHVPTHGGQKPWLWKQLEEAKQPPTIVCLCGSTRFMDAFFEAGWKETLKGKIVLSVGVCKHAEDRKSVV